MKEWREGEREREKEGGRDGVRAKGKKKSSKERFLQRKNKIPARAYSKVCDSSGFRKTITISFSKS